MLLTRTAGAFDYAREIREFRRGVEFGSIVSALDEAEKSGLAQEVEKNAAAQADKKISTPDAKKDEPGAPKRDEQAELALRTLRAEQVYRRAGMLDRAESTLADLLKKNNFRPLEDAGLTAALFTELASVQAEARRTVTTAAQRVLARADRLLKADKPEEAAKAYDAVAKTTGIPAEMLSRAQLGKMEADAAKAAGEGFVDEVLGTLAKGLITVAKTLLYLACGAALVSVLVWLRRRVKPGAETRIALVDLTVTGTDRELASQALSRQFAAGLRDGGATADQLARLDVTDDMDGASLANLRVAVDDRVKIETYVQETPLTVGPFSINPRQLFVLAREYLRRPSQSALTGSLATREGGFVMIVEHIDSVSRQAQRWEMTHQDRARAIKQMIQLVGFRLNNGSKLTDSWQSYFHHEAGKEELAAEAASTDDPAERERHLKAALKEFRESIQADPGNWLARFNLATVLRKYAENADAAAHFGFLKTMISDWAYGRSPKLNAFMDEHPGFADIVFYNEAVALSKVRSWDSHQKAMRILDALVTPSTRGERTAEDVRMETLARSARAATLLFRIEEEREKRIGRKREAKAAEFADEAFATIRETAEWFRGDLPTHAESLNWRAHAFAAAVAENACGRACFLRGELENAAEPLSRAITLMPDFIEPYTNLAALYRKQKKAGWSEASLKLLTRAIEIDPNNTRACHLLGQLYAGPEFRLYDKAIDCLSKAGLQPDVCAELAAIYADQKQDLPKAIEQMRASLALSRAADYRYVRFIIYVLDFTRASATPDWRLLKEARELALILQRSTNPADKEDATDLLRQIDALLNPPPAAPLPSSGAPTPAVGAN